MELNFPEIIYAGDCRLEPGIVASNKNNPTGLVARGVIFVLWIKKFLPTEEEEEVLKRFRI